MSQAGPAADNPCSDCGGMCCSFRSMAISYRELEPGQRYDSFMIEGDHTDQLLFEDGDVPEMEWYVGKPEGVNRRYLFFHCTHLEDGRCTEYDRRPSMCEAFECQVLEGEATLEEFQDAVARSEDALEEMDLTEVTDRVREILARKAGGQS